MFFLKIFKLVKKFIPSVIISLLFSSVLDHTHKITIVKLGDNKIPKHHPHTHSEPKNEWVWRTQSQEIRAATMTRSAAFPTTYYLGRK